MLDIEDRLRKLESKVYPRTGYRDAEISQRVRERWSTGAVGEKG
jgi:hypothetical protein